MILNPAPAQPLYTHGFYLVPRRDGRVLAGSTMERAGFDKSVTGSGLSSLSASALALVPALGAASLHSVWAGHTNEGKIRGPGSPLR